jgi:hypothetical protein
MSDQVERIFEVAAPSGHSSQATRALVSVRKELVSVGSLEVSYLRQRMIEAKQASPAAICGALNVKSNSRFGNHMRRTNSDVNV